MAHKKLISRKYLKGGILKAQNAIPGGMPTISDKIPEKEGWLQKAYKKYVPTSIQDGIEETLQKVERDGRLLFGDTVFDAIVPPEGERTNLLAWGPTTIVGTSGKLASSGLKELGFGPATKMEGQAGRYIESINNAVTSLKDALSRRAISQNTYNSAMKRLQPIVDLIKSTKTHQQTKIDEVMSTVKGRGRGGSSIRYDKGTEYAAEQQAIKDAEAARIARQQREIAEQQAKQARYNAAINKRYKPSEIGQIFSNSDGTAWYQIIKKDGKVMVKKLDRNPTIGVDGSRVQTRGVQKNTHIQTATTKEPTDIAVETAEPKQYHYTNKSSGIKVKDAVSKQTVKDVKHSVKEPKKPLTNAERKRQRRYYNGQKGNR